MKVFLVDGTYELFRHHFAVPAHRNAAGEPVAAVRAVLGSIVGMLEDGVTHLGVATDHVIESFRNDLWPGYKTGAGIDPDLRVQFEPLEDGLRALGVVVWAMVDVEADDALAAAARQAAADPRVEQVLVCTPDKDLAQCVEGDRVVQFDRRKGVVCDAAGVVERLGVPPASVPDYLALVGDSADGFPGLPGWGAKSAAAVLTRYGRLEDIPADAADWDVAVRGADKLARVLAEERDHAFLFRDLATLRTDVPLGTEVDDLRWVGPAPGFRDVLDRLDASRVAERVDRLTPK
ncbi:MAG TPA: 5'-3' exonuclease H3TH domain-containing protein [Acidimicrobiia bacterium]|nr:5'-3' exonuclease H3TH domain-containing protein [Acidimicrobiia bacterium]